MPLGLLQRASLDNNQRSFAYLVIWKQQVELVGCGIPAAGDQIISRLEAAPTEGLSNGDGSFWIS